jgi:signal transduction histidine kinase
MTSISGFIDGILDGTIPPENRDHYLNIVSVEIKRLSRLVRTLLDLSRIQCGERKFTMVDFDVSEMAMMILFSFETQIDTKKLEIEFDGAERTFVLADSDAIHQVLYNLIDNAVKFSYESGVLRVKITEQDKNVAIEVYNEGKGIPENDLPHVFDRFYKADKSRGLDKTGVGLGLFIVKAILQAHGEDISVKSEEGKNCSFMLTLPKGTDPNASKNAKRNREN